ncbi:hypothetical protein CMI42_05370 [Candidatus Pacearchaeota archaeon]|nr:hypothetical protein [Candidatus Pacearchaeota archaeon]|tara:strand:- start:480 stop:1241 length:762 start_codon:yes stop_codon:yes gene_type:complete
MNEILGSLEEIGFTEKEAKTYIALLQLKEAKTGVICKKTDIPSSHIYNILDSLIEKGVVSYKVINNVKIFIPNKPEALNTIYLKKQEDLEEQRKKIKDSIKKLKPISLNTESLSDYKYFEGISGFRAMWLEIDELLKPNSEMIILVSNTEAWEKVNPFYLEHHKKRVKNKVFERMIIPKGKMAEKMAKQRKKIGLFEPRYLDIDNEAEFAVFGNTLMIQYSGEKVPRGFLINDPTFAKSFLSLFNILWKVAKP